ncbi:MAG: serine hydrolase domain-containing protein [Novosphingobium sp.]
MPTAATPLARRSLLRDAALLGGGALLSGLPLGYGRALARPATAPRAYSNVAALIERYVGSRKLPGMVATLGSGRAPPQVIARGLEGFTDRDPVTLDSLFRIYSMTKPVTGMAAMILIDEGKLGLDQPLAEILPRFARMRVQVTPDGPLADLRPAKTAITIRHLLTHTAGLAYPIVQRGPIKAAYEAAGLAPYSFSRLPIPGLERGRAAPSLAAFADRLAEQPLVYEPGTRWSYSVGLDLMGRVIEVVSGQAFGAFLAERFFAPLGMSRTFFQIPPGETRRLTANYAILGGVPVPIDLPDSTIFAAKPPFPFGGAGLVSSPRDYDRFLAMLAGYGAIDGKRVMSERAVRLGTSNLLPPGVSTVGTMVDGHGFGAGGRVGVGELAGTYGWAGAAGTIGFVHLPQRLRAALYAQFMPVATYPVHRDFPLAVLADLRAMAEA